MHIWFITSECAPFSKSGGLADVAFSLPPVLQHEGNDVRIITPLYQCVQNKFSDHLRFICSLSVALSGESLSFSVYEGERGGVPVWFLANDRLFRREKLYGYGDDARRFAFFSKAVVDLMAYTGEAPDILHCNDWETAPVILYLKDVQEKENRLRSVRTVYTIHNIAYQGQYGRSDLWPVFGLDEKWYDRALVYVYEGRQDINLMKGAMMEADAVSTVSPTYARELHHPQFGNGLQGVVDLIDGKLYGILNGIDMNRYDAASGARLPAPFSMNDLSGKAICKNAVQKRFHLIQENDWPLIAVVARLNEQKGFDLIRDALPGLMDIGAQLVIFGQGDRAYADYFRWAQQQWPGQLGFSDDYNEETASLVFAGADMYLMPSRFEPCGLSQMMAMRYGTVPIVRETGGLKDSVRPYSDFDGIGDGFSFAEYATKDLYLAVLQAVKLYLGDPETFQELRVRCMNKDFSWNKSAGQYMRMYMDIYGEADTSKLTFQEAFQQIKAAYEAIDQQNREIHADKIDPAYHCVVEIEITGPGAGTLYVSFDQGVFQVAPYSYYGADAHVSCGFDQLMQMVHGETTIGKLFMKGQLKISGNLTKGFEIKHLLCP